MKILSFFLFAYSLLGSENPYIVNQEKHLSNQKLLQKIIKKTLITTTEGSSPENLLIHQIHKIAKELMDNGFAIDAYAAVKPAYESISLWEGETISLTFFVYIWPSKEESLRLDPSSSLFATSIHSHPIPCAFSVLNGSLTQENFEKVAQSLAQKVGIETFEKFQGPIDVLKEPFIHKIYSDSSPAFSLHAYGLSCAEKVYRSFAENAYLHTYNSTAD